MCGRGRSYHQRSQAQRAYGHCDDAPASPLMTLTVRPGICCIIICTPRGGVGREARGGVGGGEGEGDQRPRTVSAPAGAPPTKRARARTTPPIAIVRDSRFRRTSLCISRIERPPRSRDASASARA